MSRWIIVLVTCMILFHGAAPALASTATDPNSLNQEVLEKVESYIRKQFKIAGFPGGSFAVVKEGAVVHAQGIGYSDLVAMRRATPDTVYASASVTKPLTAAAILQLAEQGIIDLDAPVTTYIPWFQYRDKGKSANVTVRHLLTHSAGVNRFVADGAIYRDIGKNRNSLENTIKTLRMVKMNSEPGVKGQYCNTCYNTLGLIIEKATDMPYETYMREQLFRPLGMDDTGYAPTELIGSDIAKEYGYLFGFRKEFAPYWHEFGSSQAPEGGAYSSASDLARFLIAVSGNIDQHMKAGVEAFDLAGAIYTESGFEAKEINGVNILSKSGDGMGSSSEIVLIPALQTGFVLLIGESDGEACKRITDGVVQIMLGQTPESVDGLINALQFVGILSIVLILISLVLILWIIWSFVRLRRNHYRIKRRWGIMCRLFVYGIFAAPVWYLLLLFRPTEAGFYGYPYDLAIALITFASALSMWILYSAGLLVFAKR